MPTYKVSLSITATTSNEGRLSTSRLIESPTLLDAYRKLANVLNEMPAPKDPED